MCKYIKIQVIHLNYLKYQNITLQMTNHFSVSFAAVTACEVWIKEELDEKEPACDHVTNIFEGKHGPLRDGFGEEFFNQPSTSYGFEDFVGCFHCGRMLKCKKTMKYHIILIHGMNLGIPLRVIKKFKKKWKHQQKCYGYIPFYPQVELKVKQSKERRYQCPFCEYKATRTGNLKSHILGKHTVEKPYHCPHCEFTSAYTNHLRRHIKAKHIGEKPHKCPYCDYRSSNNGPLKIHITAKHSEAAYPCPHCEFVSVYPNHLKRHLKVKHTDERPFECNVCPYRTGLKSSLIKHISAKHTKTKPYDCPHCGYKATQSHHVTNHINAKHSYLKPFQCPECTYGASRLDHLKSHVKAKH
ncbi:zinc finger protein 711 isoform X1 [Halyomorpha halys]|uniref:zinc finger protein 711 isoform X1 n=1 Tax=Halyomorpha halys TaxID=286706 RepID=UPI0006D51C9C|nr:zinc finger protein 77-like isoform X1 [Halyomorpha halys]